MTENEQDLIDANHSLQTRLSFAEEREHNLRNQLQALSNEHNHCRNLRAQLHALENEVRRIQDKYEDEQDETDKLKEKIRLMKRTSHDGYRERYENKAAEVDELRRTVHNQAGVIRVQEAKISGKDQEIASRNRTIIYLRDFLRGLGYIAEI